MQERETLQKRIVFDALSTLDHPSAGEVYDLVHGSYPSVSRATVFRILSQAADGGRLLRLKLGEGGDRFDARLSAHGHAYCRVCHRVFDIFPESLPTKDALPLPFGFLADQVALSVVGICDACKSKK